jgi:hypothetical protein
MEVLVEGLYVTTFVLVSVCGAMMDLDALHDMFPCEELLSRCDRGGINSISNLSPDIELVEAMELS